MLKRFRQFISVILCASLVWTGGEGTQAASAFSAPLAISHSACFTEEALSARLPDFVRSAPSISIGRLFHLNGGRAISAEMSLGFAGIFGVVSYGAYQYGWSLHHLSSSGLFQVAGFLSAVYFLQMVSIAALRLWAWTVQTGWLHWGMRLANRQPYVFVPREPEMFPLILDVKGLPSADDVPFLSVRDGLQYINSSLKESFRYLPPRFQKMLYRPINFLRERHERPAHFTRLNNLPWIINEIFFAYPMMMLVLIFPAGAYAIVGGGWIVPILGLLTGWYIQHSLVRSGTEQEKEALAVNRAIERLQSHLALSALSSDEKKEIIKAGKMMQQMLPKVDRPSVAYVIDQIVRTNLTDPDRLRLQRSVLTGDEIPPTYVFGPHIFPSVDGSPIKEIAMTLNSDFVALTAVTSQTKNMEDVLGKGGVRWYRVEENVKRFNDKIFGRGKKAMLPEVVDLSKTMGDKNPWSGVFFDGGKTIILARATPRSKYARIFNLPILRRWTGRWAAPKPEEAKIFKLRIIRRWAMSSILAGVLLQTYIAGPDMAMGEEEMSEIVSAADYVQRELPNRFPRRILATTSRSKDKGAYPHEEWSVTSFTVMEKLFYILNDPELCRKLGVDPEHITLSIQGYGDVGSGIVRYLVDLNAERPDLRVLERVRILGVSDDQGGIHNPNGLNIAKLLELRDLNMERKEKSLPVFVVKDWYKEPCERMGSAEILYQGATVVIPAAIPDVFRNRLQVQKLKAAGTKILLEGANNAIRGGLEQEFHEQGIFYISGAIANFGGIFFSTQEWSDVMKHGQDWVIENMPLRRVEILSMARQVAHENMERLLSWNEETGRSLFDLQRVAVDRMRERRTELLETLRGPAPPDYLYHRVQELVTEGLPDKASRMIAATEVARREVLAMPIESILSPPAPSERMVNDHSSGRDRYIDTESFHWYAFRGLRLSFSHWFTFYSQRTEGALQRYRAMLGRSA